MFGKEAAKECSWSIFNQYNKEDSLVTTTTTTSRALKGDDGDSPINLFEAVFEKAKGDQNCYSKNTFCGGSSTGDITLTGDVSCTDSLGGGLILNAGNTLDCNGHTISYNGAKDAITVFGNDVTIKNCIIKGNFHRELKVLVVRATS